MADELTGRTVAFLMANAGVEQVELTGPRDALTKAGATVVLLAPEQGTIQAFNDDVEKGDTFDADLAVADADPADYDLLVLPGGTTNPDALRMDDDAVGFVKRVRRERQAGRRDLPRPVDAGRGRRPARQDAGQLALAQDRHPQRRRHVARRAGVPLPDERLGPDHQPQPRRHPRLQRGAGQRAVGLGLRSIRAPTGLRPRVHAQVISGRSPPRSSRRPMRRPGAIARMV